MKNCNSQNCLKIGVFGEYPLIVFAKGGGAEKPPPMNKRVKEMFTEQKNIHSIEKKRKKS